MKKIVIIIVLFSLISYGCSDFLDTEPADRYTQDNYWKTQERALAALNGVYATLLNGGMYGGTRPLYMENLSPNTYHRRGDDAIIAQGLHNSNTGWFNAAWNAAYQGIGRANNFLGNIDRVPMDSNLKERYIAEAKFLRALYYFPLWNLFGGAPLITDPTSAVDQEFLPRNSADELLTQILKDLDDASKPDVLPKSFSGAEKGRVTIGAVLALKARVLLYAGRFAEAAAVAKQVIDLNVYRLFPDYRGLFYLENEGNEEVIFDVQFKYPEFTNSYDAELIEQNNVGPLPDLVNDYYDINGAPVSESEIYDPDKPYENRDPRLKATVIVKGSMFNGAEVVEGTSTFYFSMTGYGMKKYTVYKDDTRTTPVSAGYSHLNYIVLRYADVLLMYAEAQNEASGPNDDVYKYLNEIRERAGMPDVTPGLSKDDLRKEIRHERRIELAGEGLYYYDVRRWRIAHEVLNDDIHNDKGERIDYRRFQNPRDYLWPVPSVAIQNNPNLLPQNEGYGI